MARVNLLLVLLFLFTLPLPAQAELSESALESIGRFLVLDFLTAKSAENGRPYTAVYFAKETGSSKQVTKRQLDALDFMDLRDEVSPGEYRDVMVINEVSGLGTLNRDVVINEQNQVFWRFRSQSLMHFLWKQTFGNVLIGATPLFKYPGADRIPEIFKGCKKGRIPMDWVPSKADLDFYNRTLDFNEKQSQASAFY